MKKFKEKNELKFLLMSNHKKTRNEFYIKKSGLYLMIFTLIISWQCKSQNATVSKAVPQNTMQKVFEEIKTPFKYGVVFKHPDSTKLIDSPTIFRKNKKWYMTYILYDGQGYETWLAESTNLLEWKTKGKILSFSEKTWDANQKAGYVSLVDVNWGGKYGVEKFQNKYWMSYLGGNSKGYEAGVLGVGMANSTEIMTAKEWDKIEKPIMLPHDADARWFENKTIYKSHIIHDKKLLTGHPFVMYYNAKGDTANYESIGMAVSDDMVKWERFGKNPVITKNKGICGDAQIVKYNNITLKRGLMAGDSEFFEWINMTWNKQ